MVLHDLTGQHALDLAVGDANGVITMFSREQILSKRDIGTAVAQLEIHEDVGERAYDVNTLCTVNGYEIVAGGVNGALYSFRPHQTLWKFEVAEASARLASLGSVSQPAPVL
ncbi:hypothetical protein BCR43DRAFT_446549 [Syncephalastrum racemosum]|uniref:Uncharacterized protein n=1 Tax=Syncephalastrum racemosum TaxID=13706 RepID=A0A1X2H1Y7_SYNRA|nr:hypothetical protein BCR43DRAFT_446549 [Syncephalastrum racemosum]